MKIKILNIDGKEGAEVELPKQFSEEFRPGLIARAFLAFASGLRHAYGAFPEAGKRPSAKLSKRRHNYRGSYGHGIARVPRKIFWRRGTQMGWQGAFAPGTVGGRRAHPPKADRKWEIKINKKEKKKALRSALSACLLKNIVEERGHRAPEKYPFAVETGFENTDKTKQVKNILMKLGFGREIERTRVKKIRAGKGKSRGRPYRKKTGLLIIVSKDCRLKKAAGNISGIDVCEAGALNAGLLAPGSHPARMILLTEASISKIKEKGFYL